MLAIASGAMFALHVNSTFFWMFSTQLDLSTQGSLKTLTMAASIGAVSLPLVLVACVVAHGRLTASGSGAGLCCHRRGISTAPRRVSIDFR